MFKYEPELKYVLDGYSSDLKERAERDRKREMKVLWKTKKIVALVLLAVTTIYTVALYQNFRDYEQWQQQQTTHPHVDFATYFGTYGGSLWICGEIILLASIAVTILFQRNS